MLDYSLEKPKFNFTSQYRPINPYLKPWNQMCITLKFLIQTLEKMQGSCTLHSVASWRVWGAPGGPAHQCKPGDAHMETAELQPRAPICPGQVWLSHNFGARQVCLQMGN